MKLKLDTLNREIEVEKLPLGKYAELLKALKKLPQKAQEIKGMDNQSIIELIPTLISEALPDFVDMLEIATPLKKEEIEQLDFYETTQLTLAIFETNRYKEAYELIKKSLAHSDNKKK